MKKALLYVHGKGGSAQEAGRFALLCPEYDVIGIELPDFTPWGAMLPLQREYDRLAGAYESVSLLANSIGAYFSMLALQNRKPEQAYFISPIVDMERLILDMMGWAGVSEAELEQKGTIPTDFGETLSWAYLCFVRSHPIDWKVPTHILYAGGDALTSRKTVDGFTASHQATLTVMPQGEHWFHTDSQLAFLDAWLKEALA